MLPLDLYNLSLLAALVLLPRISIQQDNTSISDEEQNNFNRITIPSYSGVSDEAKDNLNLTTVPSHSGVLDEENDTFNTTTVPSHSGASDEAKDTFNLTTVPSLNGVSDETKDTFNTTTALSHSGASEAQDTFNLTTVLPHNDTTKTGLTAACAKYITQSTAKPAVQLKKEPLCTESGAAMDQLMRFIGYQFDKHECGNPDSTAKYTELLYCSMLNAHTVCLQPFEDEQIGTKTEFVPQMSTVRWIIEELCAKNHLLAKECMFKRLKYVSRCVKVEVDSICDMENKQWKYGAIDPCRHLGVKVMCMYEGLQPCSEKTAGFMAGLINVNLRSETCTLSRGQMVQPYTSLCFKVTFVTIIFLLLT